MSFRLDRLLTLYFFGPLAKFFPPKKGLRIPILMYHSISDDQETGHPYFWINTSPARFAEHMKFLHDNHYRVISLSEAVDLIRGNDLLAISRSTSNRQPETGNDPLISLFRAGNMQLATGNIPSLGNPQPAVVNLQTPTSNLKPYASTRNPAVLTFDDGYQDFYIHAFPILKQYGFTATVYLPTSFIDNPRAGLKRKKHLSWGEVRELQSEGIEFGSHTINHLQLYDMTPEIIDLEIKESKHEIENKVGRKVSTFSYPYKFPEQDNAFIKMFQGLLQQAGYQNGVSTKIGTVHKGNEVFLLKRIPANSADGLPLFGAKLYGNYDWIAGIQNISKILLNFIRNKKRVSIE